VRVDQALREVRARGRPALVPYVLVDRARRARTPAVAQMLKAAGATALELGFPFSDPIADGPVLEAASDRALKDGTHWSDLIASLRAVSTILPSAVMTYANPVWRHGLTTALRELSDAGASALIIPDLSLEDSGPWERAARAEGISLVLLAAPGASADRVTRLARCSRGFLYLVSRYGTTGAGSGTAASDLGGIVRLVHRAAPRLPVLVGFGIRDRASVTEALGVGADGVIVGSALEERLARGESLKAVGRWVGSLLPQARGT